MPQSRRAFFAVLASAAGALLAACSRLDALNGVNAITPGDGAVDRVGHDIAFGDGDRQQLDVYAPKAAKDLPVVVFYYGGSWMSGSRSDYGFAARAIAARGFVVVVPDYRLVPQVRYPAFVEDGAAAIAWTARHVRDFGGDPARIGVTGHSAGAYIALMLALDPEWLAKAGAPGAIKAAVGLAGPYDFYPFDPGGAADAAFGSFPDPRATQPIAHVRADAPPVLLLQGDADETVKPRNATALAAALSAQGAPAEARLYPGVGHIGILLGLSKTFRGKSPALADLAGFFQARL
jgi:acetyl esterase/lipase